MSTSTLKLKIGGKKMKHEEIMRAYFGVHNIEDVWTNSRNIDIIIDQRGMRDLPMEPTFEDPQPIKLTVLMSDIYNPFRLSKDCDHKKHFFAARSIMEEATDDWGLAFIEAEAGRKTRFRLYYLHHSFLPYADSLQELKNMLFNGTSRERQKICVFDHVAENIFAIVEIGENLAYVLERRDAGDPSSPNSFAAITEIRHFHQRDRGIVIRKTREVQRITSHASTSGWEFGTFLEKLTSVNALGAVTNPNFKPIWSMPYHRDFPNGWR